MEQSVSRQFCRDGEGVLVTEGEQLRITDRSQGQSSERIRVRETPSATKSMLSVTERQSGLYFQAATDLDSVQAAWSLVYDRYLEAGLIEPNPFEIYTHSQAVGRHACVVFGPIHGHVASTMTLIADGPSGLCLDSVYRPTLDQLRSEGRRLLEVSLLADRRAGVTRGGAALFDMMRWTAYYAFYLDATDVIIGVHPHHARFYERCFGFKSFGPTTVYPAVRDNPVVPLRLIVGGALENPVLPRGLRHIRDNPLDSAVFDRRFGFEGSLLKASRVQNYLDMKGRAQRLSLQ